MISTPEFRQVTQTQLRGDILIDSSKSPSLQNQLVAKYLIDQAIDIVLPEVKFDKGSIEIRDKIELDLSEDSTNVEK